MDIERVGYPIYTLYAFLFVGGILAFIRPFWAFLLGITIINGVNIWLAVSTRFSIYFNLNDAILLILFISLFIDRISKGITIPFPVTLMLSVIAMGGLNTIYSFGIHHEVIRMLRVSLDFPLGFLIGANMLDDEDRINKFIYASIIGSCLGAIGSFFEYSDIISEADDPETVRHKMSQKGLGAYLLVAGLLYPFFNDNRKIIKWIWFIILILFASTLLFAKWRSVYIAVIISLIVIPIYLGKISLLKRAVSILLIFVPMTLIILYIIFPQLGPESYFSRISIEAYNPQADANFTRWNQIEVELGEWAMGNWIIGRGLEFNAFLYKKYFHDLGYKGIAFGHIGYVKYLSNLGLIGLFVFGIYIPYIIFRASKRLYLNNLNPAFNKIAIVGLCIVCMEVILQGMNSSYLGSSRYIWGCVYGSIWYLDKLNISSNKYYK